jgi:hypothetical protein
MISDLEDIILQLKDSNKSTMSFKDDQLEIAIEVMGEPENYLDELIRN